MTARPAAETVRSPGWIAAAAALLAAVAFMYAQLFVVSWPKWLSPDYSHAFLVPVFAAYLAWTRRDRAPADIRWPDPWGLAFLAGGVALFLAAAVTNLARETLWGASLVLNLCGAARLLGGRQALAWLWPSLAFLMFMFPLPYRVEHAIGWPLQNVSARGAEFVLQTVGYATYREGVILHVVDHRLEVEKACNGLSMLLTFFAVSAAVAVLVKRPRLDRALVVLSAVPIGVVANVLRIALTGVLYNELGPERPFLGSTVGQVCHDAAGWFMMPLALGMLWAELKVLDWVFVEGLVQASREEVIKLSASPVHLFMPDFLGPDGRPVRKPPAAR